MDIVDLLNKQADEIANAGHNGWGNTMLSAAEIITALRAQLSLSKPVDGWISVEDRLPQESTFVDVIWSSKLRDDYKVRQTSVGFINGKFNPFEPEKRHPAEYISHWMKEPPHPINAAPKPIDADKESLQGS